MIKLERGRDHQAWKRGRDHQELSSCVAASMEEAWLPKGLVSMERNSDETSDWI
jgi:hypothetical protein